MSDHKPADHILDEFLGGHQVRTTVAEFSGLLKELRASIAEEIALLIEAECDPDTNVGVYRNEFGAALASEVRAFGGQS